MKSREDLLDERVQKIVLNVPHSSVFIPEWAANDITIPDAELEMLIRFMADKDVDKLWSFVPEENKQIATVSRLVVDMERYPNDADELNRRIYDNAFFGAVQDICRKIYQKLNA